MPSSILTQPTQDALVARLTDSAPPFICAWCPDFDPLDPKNRGASHGLCEPCRQLMEREIA